LVRVKFNCVRSSVPELEKPSATCILGHHERDVSELARTFSDMVKKTQNAIFGENRALQTCQNSPTSVERHLSRSYQLSVSRNFVLFSESMSTIKSFAVGNGDMFYISHNSDNFTIIDCNLTHENKDSIIDELKHKSKLKGITRFICTHPDQDHFGGIEKLDAELPIENFYVVKNQAIKSDETESFKHYCALRDDENKAFYIYKGCSRKWMNLKDETRGSSGISVLWPDTNNKTFKDALASCDAGESYNNTSAVIRYEIEDGASIMWLGDLETDFMEEIFDEIELTKTTVVFASHHGRASGKIPNSWLEKLDPQIIIIGEAPSRHLHYYTGYQTITQNSAGDITMECNGNKIHFYVANSDYKGPDLNDEAQDAFEHYIGSLTVETEYTLDN
jgi:beta-lactamase superfamily II metal-dependent hydrolase